jgi:hypothetical protein
MTTDLRAFDLNACPTEEGTNRYHVAAEYLTDRETLLKMFAELGEGSSIIFTFEGGLSGSHSITETAHSAQAWKRAYAHWEGYVAANNDTLARRAKGQTIAEQHVEKLNDTIKRTHAAQDAAKAPKAKRPKVKRTNAERTLKRYGYRLVNMRNRADTDMSGTDYVEAYTKAEARAIIAEGYRNEIPPARYGFYPFSAHRIVWTSEQEA